MSVFSLSLRWEAEKMLMSIIAHTMYTLNVMWMTTKNHENVFISHKRRFGGEPNIIPTKSEKERKIMCVWHWNEWRNATCRQTLGFAQISLLLKNFILLFFGKYYLKAVTFYTHTLHWCNVHISKLLAWLFYFTRCYTLDFRFSLLISQCWRHPSCQRARSFVWFVFIYVIFCCCCCCCRVYSVYTSSRSRSIGVATNESVLLLLYLLFMAFVFNPSYILIWVVSTFSAYFSSLALDNALCVIFRQWLSIWRHSNIIKTFRTIIPTIVFKLAGEQFDKSRDFHCRHCTLTWKANPSKEYLDSPSIRIVHNHQSLCNFHDCYSTSQQLFHSLTFFFLFCCFVWRTVCSFGTISSKHRHYHRMQLHGL